LVCTEVTVPEDTVNPPLGDNEPVVILDDPPRKRRDRKPPPPVLDDLPRKRRDRKPQQVNVVAPAVDEAKLTEHEQDRRSAEPVPASPAEDSIPNENSQALA